VTIQIYEPNRENSLFRVWAEPEPGDKYLGLCVGIGCTKQQALEDASKTLGAAMAQVAELGKL